MKKSVLFAAVGLALGASSAAMADFTFPSFNIGPDVAQVNTWSGIALNNASIPAGLYTGYEVLLDWQSTGNSGTNNNNAWSSEARFNFASAVATGGTTTATVPGGTTAYTALNSSTAPTGSGGNGNNVNNIGWSGSFSSVYNAANPLAFNFRQAFAGFSTQDVTWSNVRIKLVSFVPPTPPANAIDLGTVGGNNTIAMGVATYTANQVNWFKFTLTQSIPAADVGKWLSVDTYGNTLTGGDFGDNDTEIALYDSNGILVGNNDDHAFGGSQTESLLTYGDLASSDFVGATGTGVDNGALAAGVYYIAASPFNLNAGAGFAATVTPSIEAGQTLAGDIKVTVKIPAPGAFALLGLGGLVAARRRRA